MRRLVSLALALVSIIAVSHTARAADETFDLLWSGAFYGNSAVATGTITMDPTLFIPVGYNDNSGYLFPPAVHFVSALSITVSGAFTGNGTFGLSDFNTITFNENGGALNFSQQLIGQPTGGGPWGSTLGFGGDFNLVNDSQPGQADAPNATQFFTLTTDDGAGQTMVLTSFLPTSTATPEPGACTFIGSLALSGVALLLRRRNSTV